MPLLPLAALVEACPCGDRPRGREVLEPNQFGSLANELLLGTVVVKHQLGFIKFMLPRYFALVGGEVLLEPGKTLLYATGSGPAEGPVPDEDAKQVVGWVVFLSRAPRARS